MGYFDAHGDEHLLPTPQEKDEDYEYDLWKYREDKETGGKGLPPDGLIEEWKHGH